MNATRVAQLLRELADAIDEPDEQPKEEPRRKPARPFPAPLHPVSDTDRMRAQKMLRRRGIG